MKIREKLSVIPWAAVAMLLSVLLYMPLAWGRLTGRAVPFFGDVRFFDLPQFGLLALAAVVCRFSRLIRTLKEYKSALWLAGSSALLLLTSFIRELRYGGSWEHTGVVLFYAMTPLAAMLWQEKIKRALPAAAGLTGIFLLASGIMSEHFTGLCGNWNWTMSLTAALLPGVVLFFPSRHPVKLLFTGGTLLLILLAVCYRQEISRGMVLAVVFTVPFLRLWGKVPRKIRLPGAVVLILAGIAAVLLAAALLNIRESRFQLWRGCWEMLKHHPFLGVGSLRFSSFIGSFLPEGYWSLPFSAHFHPHPHNELLYLWGSFGLAGLLFIAMLVCGVLTGIARDEGSLEKYFPAWIFFIIFISGMFDLTAAIPAGAVWMLTAAGVHFPAAAEHFPAAETDETAAPASRLRWLLPVLLAAAALFSAVSQLRATLALREGNLALYRNDLPAARKNFNRSLAIRETREARYKAAEVALNGDRDLPAALAHLEKLEKNGYPDHLHANRMKAVILANQNRLEEALTAIRRECRLYPRSIYNAYLHWQLTAALRRPAAEQRAARDRFTGCCRLRNVPVEAAVRISWAFDDAPPPPPLPAEGKMDHSRMFPGVITEIAGALLLILAALGAGALLFYRRHLSMLTEFGCGTVICALAGAVFPAQWLIFPFAVLAAWGAAYNFERIRQHWKTVLFFTVPVVLMLGNALLPPGSWDEQVYQISLLKHYGANGFFALLRDNPYSAYPSLVHAYLLPGFELGGATAARLTVLFSAAMTGAWLSCKLAPAGKFTVGTVLAALFFSPLTLLMVRNFYVEPFILIFTLAGAAALLKNPEKDPDAAAVIAAGIAAGGAAAVKLTGGGAALGLLVLLLFRSFRWKSILLFSAGALAAGVLFYLRTWLFFGNPFYPYFSAWAGAGESAVQVEKFHRLLGGHYGLDPLTGTLFGWLFPAFKPELYDGISCGFQFPLIFIFALAGAFIAARRHPAQRNLFAGGAAAVLSAYIFWGLTSQQTRFLFPVFFCAAILMAAAAFYLPPLFRRIMNIVILIATILSLFSLPGALMHYYFSFRVLNQARRTPAAFAGTREPLYVILLHRVAELPENSRIAMLTERRSLYMPRKVTLLMPYFQEKLTPIPDDRQKLLELLREFDYLVVRPPRMDVDRAPEYDGELERLYSMMTLLLKENKLTAVPGTQGMILRVEPAAAGNALSSSVSRPI